MLYAFASKLFKNFTILI